MVAAGLVLVPYCLAAVEAVVDEDDLPNHGVVEDMVYLHHNVGDPDAAADLDALADPVLGHLSHSVVDRSVVGHNTADRGKADRSDHTGLVVDADPNLGHNHNCHRSSRYRSRYRSYSKSHRKCHRYNQNQSQWYCHSDRCRHSSADYWLLGFADTAALEPELASAAPLRLGYQYQKP